MGGTNAKEKLLRSPGAGYQQLEQAAGQTYSFRYSYNLAGALTSETYPSGRVITNSYDGANRSRR